MFKKIIIILISAFAGYGAKYFWDKKLILYNRKIKAIEKLRKATNILVQGQMLYAQMRLLNFKKIEELDEFKKGNIQQALDTLQIKQTIDRLLKELELLNIQNDVQPYIPDDIWIIFNAYRNLFTTAISFLIFTPYCLDSVNKDKIKESIIKNIIPCIPEEENFIKEDPIKRIFHIEELIRNKLLTAIENLNKRNLKKKQK